jgi:hypothetical protein
MGVRVNGLISRKVDVCYSPEQVAFAIAIVLTASVTDELQRN